MKIDPEWICRAAAIVFLLGLIGISASRADDTAVDLELVLAVDVSFSMDADEQRLQLDGYVSAFRHGEVIAAIQSGLHRRIAVIFVEWGGVGFQRVKVPWTLIDGADASYAFADRLAEQPLAFMPRTSITDAISRVVPLFEQNKFKGLRKVIDVSGDGPNNQGSAVTLARDAAVSKGITINGLPVLLRPGEPAGFFDLENLDVYYEDCVIGGPGSFIVPVRNRANFTEAIRRKLILEMAAPPVRVQPARLMRAQLAPRGPRVDCLIGEKLWERWLDNSGP
ncbi:MAG: DUF1194 domain-containing protein [Hyphomicrobiales bacterium]|nr:DUF1194 domain-containing protein [Hyphomicrobiales bacterium]